MTTKENTTRPTATKLTRRNMLKSMAAASTATIALPVGMADSSEHQFHETSSLGQLIENHRRAWQTFEDHCSEACDMESEYDAKHQRPLVPTTLTPEGKAPTYFELDFKYPGETEDKIERAHAELRAKHLGDVPKMLAPENWQSMADAIDGSEARCMAALEEAIVDEETRREAYGLADAERDWTLMDEAEDAAIVEIMRYVPTTAADAEEKASYLMGWHSKGRELDDHHFEALLQGQGRAQSS